MKSKELYDLYLEDVYSSRGAPMGRGGFHTKDFGPDTKVFDRKVDMVDGAYDKGGAYWGIGAQLRVNYSIHHCYFYRIDMIRNPTVDNIKASSFLKETNPFLKP